MEGAVTPDFISRIEADVARNRFGFNRNEITGVVADQQYYLVDMLAVSKAFFDYCTHPVVRGISRQLIGQQYRMSALRYYETLGGHHMQWHTDNKTDEHFADNPGIIFITYVSDVDDGEFQYISGSHKWSGKTAYNDYPDDLIAEQYAAEIVSFKLPARLNDHLRHLRRPSRKARAGCELCSQKSLFPDRWIAGQLRAHSRQYRLSRQAR
jgi:hypothetical protein